MPHRLITPQSISVLGALRALVPTRERIAFTQSLRIAERQANHLLELRGIGTAPTPIEIISRLPKITVEYTGQPVWGATFWDPNRQSWIIQLPNAEPQAHNRFTLAHEYKHIIDHGRHMTLYRGTRQTDPQAQAEQAADYFAGCLLVPRRLLKAQWNNGIQTTGELADLFDVSEYTVANRLRQIGLVDHRHLRHLPAPLPFIGDDETDESTGGDTPSHNTEGEALSA